VGKKQKSKGNPFADKIPAPTTPDITVTLEKTQHQISVNLKYYHAKSQCLSQWQRDELKKLSRFFAKVQAMTWSQIREDYGLGLSNHCAPPAAGFSRPAILSPDIKLCELRVNGTARVHGIQDDSTFFLIWALYPNLTDAQVRV